MNTSAGFPRRCARRRLLEEHRARTLVKTYLESSVVKPATERVYYTHVYTFLLFAEHQGFQLESPAAVDAALSVFFNECFANGDTASTGRTTLSGWEHFFCEYSKRGQQGLPRAHRSVDSWKKQEVPSSRPPLAWEMACAIACDLAAHGYGEIGAYVLITFDLYSRPSEALAIRGLDVIPPISGTQFSAPAIRLDPKEERTPSQTGTYDDVLQLSSGRRHEAGVIAMRLAALRRSQGQKMMFLCDYSEVHREFCASARRVGLGHRVLYELRHGGASDDGALDVHPTLIQRRGRWKVETSVRRYGKKGVLQETWADAPLHVRNFCLLCSTKVLEVLEQPNLMPAGP